MRSYEVILSQMMSHYVRSDKYSWVSIVRLCWVSNASEFQMSRALLSGASGRASCLGVKRLCLAAVLEQSDCVHQLFMSRATVFSCFQAE